MSSLNAVFEGFTEDDGGFAIAAPEAWGQGRTLYGGMTAALAYEALKRGLGDLGPLRSAQFTFVGPASGRLRFQPNLLRRGRSSAIVGVESANEDGQVARSTFVFGGARDSKVAHDYLAMPRVDAPEACGPFRKEGAGARPGFWNEFETRLAGGGRMFDTTAPKPEFMVWARFLDVEGADPVTAMLAMADCLPPAALVHFPTPGPISTMTWTIDVLRTPTRAAAWYLLWSSSEYASDGYSMQAMTMWSEAGEPLAVGRQAVAIFV